MPQDFPCTPYNAVYWRLFFLPRGSVGDAAYQLRARALDGWQGVAYYFRSCAEHDEAFADSLRRYGYAIREPGRYIQEKELFDFFVNGLAAIECLAFSLFAMAELINERQPHTQKLENPKRINVERTVKKFEKVFPEETITVLMRRLVDPEGSPEYAEWRDVRNFLSHRAAPARSYLSVWTPFEYASKEDILAKGVPINDNLTASRRAWLANTIADLLVAADSFSARHF